MRRNALIAAAAFAVGVTRVLARGRVPDDYDSIGFVLSLDHFDLATLRPHFPGYPVYVVLGKIMHTLVSPLLAAQLVSALAAAATSIGLWHLAERAAPRAGFWAVAFYAAAWLPWYLGGAALSDSTAGAFCVLAFACAGRPFLS